MFYRIIRKGVPALILLVFFAVFFAVLDWQYASVRAEFGLLAGLGAKQPLYMAIAAGVWIALVSLFWNEVFSSEELIRSNLTPGILFVLLYFALSPMSLFEPILMGGLGVILAFRKLLSSLNANSNTFYFWFDAGWILGFACLFSSSAFLVFFIAIAIFNLMGGNLQWRAFVIPMVGLLLAIWGSYAVTDVLGFQNIDLWKLYDLKEMIGKNSFRSRDAHYWSRLLAILILLVFSLQAYFNILKSSTARKRRAFSALVGLIPLFFPLYLFFPSFASVWIIGLLMPIAPLLSERLEMFNKSWKKEVFALSILLATIIESIM